jgi:hypothetical protein
VLAGHEHDPEPHATKSPRGEALYLQAGCLYGSREYPNSYFVVDIDPQDRTVTVQIRRWSERTGVFDAATEIAKGGVAQFALPGGGAAAELGHPPFSQVMGAIARAAAALRVLPEDMSAYAVLALWTKARRPIPLLLPSEAQQPLPEATAVATGTRWATLPSPPRSSRTSTWRDCSRGSATEGAGPRRPLAVAQPRRNPAPKGGEIEY